MFGNVRLEFTTMTDMGTFVRCVSCGGVDADTELGWQVCGSCFRIDDPVQACPVPAWVVGARVAALVMFLVAAAFLIATLHQLS